MTLNERLFSQGLLAKFDTAVLQRDRAALLTLLARVEVDDPESLADRLLANPALYGLSARDR